MTAVAWRRRLPQRGPRASRGVAARPAGRSFAWAGYAASAWAIAYAVGVRFYQAAGGTLGLPGTFEDPAAIHRASLIAGVVILPSASVRSRSSGPGV